MERKKLGLYTRRSELVSVARAWKHGGNTSKPEAGMRTIFTITISVLITVTTYAASTPEELVLKMTDKTARWDARCEAEDSLAAFSPQKVLPVLLSHIGKGMPSSVICNSGGRDFDKKAPVEWQIFYAISRSWNHQVNALPRDSGGTILLRDFTRNNLPILLRILVRIQGAGRGAYRDIHLFPQHRIRAKRPARWVDYFL